MLSFLQDMLPIIFCFDLPFMGLTNLFDVQRDSFLQQVEKQYDVQVSYKHRPKLMVCVKGVVESASRTKEAANLVLKHHYREYAVSYSFSLLERFRDICVAIGVFVCIFIDMSASAPIAVEKLVTCREVQALQ